MELSEYEHPDDRYTPRPKASQAVAAAKRAAHHDTEPITPLVTPARQYVPFGVGALLIMLLMIGMASYQLSRAPARPLQIETTPSSAPAFVAAPTAAPAPTSAPTALIATINAYAAPDGLLLGPIELDRAIVPVAHYGSGWVQANVAGSGLVWLRAGDVPDVALEGPDLAPVAAQPQNTINRWTPPASTPESTTGEKAAPDRAAHHAAAVAHDQQTHGSK